MRVKTIIEDVIILTGSIETHSPTWHGALYNRAY